MKVEDFLDFREPNYIRLKGSRMGLDDVLWNYLKNGDTAEDIHQRFGVPLSSVYAAILYYLADPEKVGKYIQDILEADEAAYQEQQNNPDPKTLELRQRFAAILAEREATEQASTMAVKPE